MRPTLILLAALAGCASSSGVFRSGPDAFTISTSASHGRGGLPAAKQMAFEAATAECTRQGRGLEVIAERGTPPSWTDGMYRMDLDFRCR